MNKKPSFFRQALVLIQRYFHIFFNDKQNIILTIAIPLLTILIVCLVACPDMYAVKPKTNENTGLNDNIRNDGYPVLIWEAVPQEKKKDDKDKKDSDDKDEHELIEPEKPSSSTWNGDDVSAPTSPTQRDGENYFLITDASQLAFLSKCADNKDYQKYLRYNYILQANIDLNKKEFEPIGNSDHPFEGTFDGNGNIIKNLKITKKDNYVGLFGCVRSDENAKTDEKISGVDMTFYHNGIVKNLQVKNVDIDASGKYVGAIAGKINKTSRLKSVCVKDGTIKADKGYLGGIVGFVDSADAEVYLCYSRVKLVSKGENVGGLVGSLDSGRLSGAYTTSEIDYNGSGNGKGYGMAVGKCGDGIDKSLKNVFYIISDSDKDDEDYKGVNNQDDTEGCIEGVKTDDLRNYASFMVPFKGIETAYDIANPDDDEEEKDDDYDAEKDKDIDDEYGFKKDDQLLVFNATQTGLFMLVCVAIFVGICNSIQEICKERNILKREYMTNLNLSSYVISKLVVQAVVCAVQMVVVVGIFAVFVRNKILPDSGVMLSMWTEYYITMFLLAFAADTMSLVISSLVKTSATANTFIPIILIVQIVFSGVLFDMKGVMDAFSKIMISKWGIAALAASTGLNDSMPKFLIDNPDYQLNLGSEMSTVNDLYASTNANLFKIWGILLIFIIVCSVACRLLLTRVKKDKR